MARETDADLDQLLSSVPLFSGLSRRQRGRLLGDARRVTHPAGREIAKEGEGALALHLIVSGAASVSVGGREVRTLGPGDYFGEISLIDGKPRSASVSAVDDLDVLAVSHAAFRRLVDEDPTCAREVMVALCGRLRDAEARQT